MTKRFRWLLVPALLVGISGVVAVVKADDDVQELTKIKQQWSEAEKSRDANGYLEQLFDDDFEILNGRGHFDKQQMIDSLKDPDLTMSELRSDNIKVRIYGNVAVMTDHASSSGMEKGKPFARQADFVRIFLKENGKWRAKYAQATPAQKPQ